MTPRDPSQLVSDLAALAASSGRSAGKEIEAQVLVVGAGPVGLTLAMDLASRGVQVLIAESRRADEPPSVKCNHVAARSMEQFRRLGVAAAVREAGLPGDYPHDVAFRTSVTGIELNRVHIPARAEREHDQTGPDGWWPTPEPPHRVNQIYLEPILAAHAARMPGLTLMHGMQVTGFLQDEAGVTANACKRDDGTVHRIRCHYLVGCDGGRSLVRKIIGARFEGTDVVQRVQSTFLRAPSLRELIPGRLAWGFQSYNARRCGTTFAIDGRELWLVHNHLNPGEDPARVDRDRSLRAILGVDSSFEYEVLAKEDWVARRLVADRFRDRRVFICGDAAHIWIPQAGYGMNAGIADAMNLSWMLAACLDGWAPPRILDAHEAERLPITEQVSRLAMSMGLSKIKVRTALPENLEEDSAEGRATRDAFGRTLHDLNVQQFCCAGLNFGYFYDRSPLIVYDGEQAPPFTMGSFESSTVPGCRCPHFWLRDGRSLYDELGPGYTLLRFSPVAAVDAFMEAACRLGVPMTLLELGAEDVPPVYRHALVLVRPDQHIAWRADSIPTDVTGLVDRIRGG